MLSNSAELINIGLDYNKCYKTGNSMYFKASQVLVYNINIQHHKTVLEAKLLVTMT